MKLCDRTARELSRELESGGIRPRDIVRSVTDRISAVESTVGSYITVDSEGASRRANDLDTRPFAVEKRGPLWGVPVAVKDNICTGGLPTTCASRMLEDYTPPYSATAVRRLEEAGSVIVGKSNLDEFGMGSSTEHSALRVTRNPWNPQRVPGGSSGGSAAAVCAGEAVVALGSDTGGSVRLPAAFCGVVGMRPTYGTVSRYGLVAFGSSMDQIGVLARDAHDCAAVMAVIARPDARDSNMVSSPARPGGGVEAFNVSGAKVGVPLSFLESGVDADVLRAFESALKDIERLGAAVVPVDLMDPSYAVSAYYVIADCEASSNLARYDGVRYGRRSGGSTYDELVRDSRRRFLGPEVKRRIMLGTFALSAGYYDKYYSKAVRVRRRISNDFLETLKLVDFLAMPTAPGPAFRIGERLEDPLKMYLTDVFTVGPCLAGLPAVSLPMGMATGGLPMGLQLVGRRLADWDLLGFANAFQRVTGHHKLRPPLQALGSSQSGGDGGA